jgi:hypothetical protein
LKLPKPKSDANSNGVAFPPIQLKLPSIPPRAVLPSPLKFLWFHRENSLEKDVAEGFEGSEDDIKEEGVKSFKSWVPNLVNLTYLLKRYGGGGEEADANVRVPGRCHECECEVCTRDHYLEAEVKLKKSIMGFEIPVVHDKESFGKFLHRVQYSELQFLGRMAYLANQAYYIPELKKEDLLKHHELHYVTSSFERKAALAAKEKPADSTEEIVATEKKSRDTNENGTYALAATAASYLANQTKSFLPFKNGTKSEDDAKVAELEVEATEEDTSVAELVAPIVAEDETKDAVAEVLQSDAWCPSEWFVCDEESTSTRYFAIQGSDSLASWQANLLFESSLFEEPEWGVMVHRGMYEAAKGLYEQLMPLIQEHVNKHGEKARFYFTGHSLGGSLSTLLTLMLRHRGVLPLSAMLPVYTFGSPSVLCGGDWLLEKLGFPLSHVQSVVMHYDIVPRSFACHYPDQIIEVLKRLNGTFRNHACLQQQKLMYAAMGKMLILQPDSQQAPVHPFLPPGGALYEVRHPEHDVYGASLTDPHGVTMAASNEIRSAERSFLNTPHPLEILSDPGSYGPEGTISRDHDSRQYLRAVNTALKEEFKRWEQRRRLWGAPLKRSKSLGKRFPPRSIPALEVLNHNCTDMNRVDRSIRVEDANAADSQMEPLSS